MMVVVIITPFDLIAIALVAIPLYEVRIRVIKWEGAFHGKNSVL